MGYQCTTTVDIGTEKVGIALSHGALGGHLGVAFSDEDGNQRLMHLGWHERLFIETYPAPQSKWAASVVDLRPSSAMQALALIRAMADKYSGGFVDEGIHYGINLIAGANAINQDGSYSPVDGNDGYTCASIVAAMFTGVGLPLVNLSTWENREANKIWGRAILCMLRATVSAQHVAAVEKNNNGLRLRPEEVAAAAEVPQASRPVDQAAIEKRADEIMGEMQVICGAAAPQAEGSPVKPCVDMYHKELAEHALKVAAERAAAEQAAASDAPSENAEGMPVTEASLEMPVAPSTGTADGAE